ncbi:MAG: hydrolase [Pirellulaceae bacterium]|nr:MAG: hydrolase [Pirellulaceae bacterium]
MTTPHEQQLRRSPELLSREESALLVVDVQEKLLPLIPGSSRLVWNIARLIDAAKLLGVPCAATEQYPKGLGGTHPELAARLPERPAKQRFSCCGCGGIPDRWAERGLTKIVVAGIETHVCVLQTVLDLLSEGFRVYVVADAVAARHPLDHDIALRRMDSQGAILTTCESVMFEWCETSAAPEFKQISPLIRQSPPEP